ncbi:MAG: hypothetical protein J0M30_02780 [Chitinophagales bacterium]|nr:hypothetical protein [Chitinophagales bacterium]
MAKLLNGYLRICNIRTFLFCLFFSSMIGLDAEGQVTGPQCVRQGTIYQYNISTNSGSQIEVCVSGGEIVGSDSICRTQATVSDLQIIWSSSVTNGTIQVKSGSSVLHSFSVAITDQIFPGVIDSMVTEQEIINDSIPSPIGCSLARLGNCNASFAYQWQQSEDNLIWTDISGATNQSLGFQSAPTHTTFYRRKVREMNSGETSFSPVAIVRVTIVVDDEDNK